MGFFALLFLVSNKNLSLGCGSPLHSPAICAIYDQGYWHAIKCLIKSPPNNWMVIDLLWLHQYWLGPILAWPIVGMLLICDMAFNDISNWYWYSFQNWTRLLYVYMIHLIIIIIIFIRGRGVSNNLVIVLICVMTKKIICFI